jgi:D-aspartate ligase
MTALDSPVLDEPYEAPAPAPALWTAPRTTAKNREARATDLAPALLTDATWYGTLSAVRDLGSRGVPVIVGYDRATAPARWSRFTSCAVRCPPTHETYHFLDWLHEFGERNPGCVLYPTSDDIAFMISAHRQSLERLFQLFSPRLDSLLQVLDKSRLAAAAERAGLSSAPTWTPADEDALREMVPDLPLPSLVKPRAQILSAGGKGIRVDRREDLVEAWRRLAAAASEHHQALTEAFCLDRPIIQPFVQVSESIYTVDGFVDARGRLVGALACMKLLQLPRRSGAGVYFEHAPLDPDIARGLERLCRETGHIGVFDAEFAVHGDEKLLIDFNPRFYNHMAFEVDRGLPLPWLSYLAATGRGNELHRVARQARREAATATGVYVHGLPMRVMLAAQRASGSMTRAESRRWRRSIVRRNRLSNAAYARQDRLPALADLLQLGIHPRSLVRRAAQ